MREVIPTRSIWRARLLFSVIDGAPEFTDVTGLTERRERKRARREIMDPREDRAGTRDEKENKKDAKNDKKKQRIPAGLALMHGFSSASVGKSRLTVREKSSMVGILPYPALYRSNRRQISVYSTRAKPPRR